MGNESPQIGYLIKHAQSLVHVHMEDALEPLGLTVSHYSCLFHLRRSPGISASELARRTFVTRQSMNAMLHNLLDRGLVARSAQGESGRALPTALTPLGARLLDEAQALVDAVEGRMLANLTASERVALGGGLTAVVRSLE